MTGVEAAPAGPVRALGLTRVSTRDQAEDGYGLVVQSQRITDYCRTQDWELFGIEGDGPEKGALPLGQRPALLAALAAVKERRDDPVPISRVVVDRFDRLGRDAMESLLAEREFAALGARVTYVSGMNGDDPQTKFMRHVMDGIAELDKDLLVAKLRDGKAAKAARGEYTGGRPPLGYTGRKGKLVPVPEQARVVQFIFDRVARDKWTTRRVAAVLTEHRALGRRWDQATVRSVLHRETYKLGRPPMVDPRIYNRAHAVLAARRPHRERAAA